MKLILASTWLSFVIASLAIGFVYGISHSDAFRALSIIIGFITATIIAVLITAWSIGKVLEEFIDKH